MKIDDLVKSIVEKIRTMIAEESKQLEEKLNSKQVTFDFDLSFDEQTRSLKVTAKSADQEVCKEIKLPTMIYRGVFCEEFTYEKGDCVTSGGSMWVCKSDQTQCKPGAEGNKDWQLSVKRGRDGKDLKGE